jgi:hypothetical protein
MEQNRPILLTNIIFNIGPWPTGPIYTTKEYRAMALCTTKRLWGHRPCTKKNIGLFKNM